MEDHGKDFWPGRMSRTDKKRGGHDVKYSMIHCCCPHIRKQVNGKGASANLGYSKYLDRTIRMSSSVLFLPYFSTFDGDK